MKIVDLFSGAGGLTFGFYYKLKNEKFIKNRDNEFVFANEYDRYAIKTFKRNFPDVNLVEGDIKELNDDKVREIIGTSEVDLIIGGPPCQSYSTVGQRKYDDKAKLYEEYLRILQVVKPKMFLFENVKGILSMREVFYEKDANGNIIYDEICFMKNGKERIRKKPRITGYGEWVLEKIKQRFAEVGYKIIPKVLNAVNFGVPQNRERVFIIGIRSDLKLNWSFPVNKQEQLITISEAISDLPILFEGENVSEYNRLPQHDYQILMRGKNKILTSHFCGFYGEKIRTVIKNVKQGQGKNDFNSLVKSGKIDAKFELTSGYANTYGRLVETLPATTITNNMSTPSGLRCIHYSQDRALTPREGARIQSFPDWFIFEGSRTEITKQIGNAVPPLLAMALARKIEETLECQ